MLRICICIVKCPILTVYIFINTFGYSLVSRGVKNIAKINIRCTSYIYTRRVKLVARGPFMARRLLRGGPPASCEKIL